MVPIALDNYKALSAHRIFWIAKELVVGLNSEFYLTPEKVPPYKDVDHFQI
jgi:hypothetical protein